MADEIGAPPPPPPGFVPANDPPPPPAGFVPVQAPGLLESFGRGAAEGATFGFDSRLGLDQSRREESRRTNPWAHFTGEVLGGVIPMVGAWFLPGGQVASAARAGSLLSRGANLVGSGARTALVPGEINTLGQAALQGSKLGATYGALTGAGHADTSQAGSNAEALGQMGAGALQSGMIGGALGAPLGMGAHALFRGAQGIGGMMANARAETGAGSGTYHSGALTAAVRGFERDRITPDDLISMIRAEIPSDTASTPGGIATRFWGASATGPRNQRQPWTADQVEEVVRRSMAGQTASQIETAMAGIAGGRGPGTGAIRTLLAELEGRYLAPLNLLDRASLVRTGSGDNTQMMMRAAAATPGEARGIARESLLERQLGAGGRLQDAFARMVGSTDYDGVAARQLATFQQEANQAYALALASERPFDLQPLFNTWEGNFAQMRGIIPDTIRTRLRAMMTETVDPTTGAVNRVAPNSLQGFMYAREGLRDLIGELPQGNNLRRHLTRFYGEMTDEVGRTNPLWREANQIYRDGMAGQDALQAGAGMSARLNGNTREGLKVFTDARQRAIQARRDLIEAQNAEAAKIAGGGQPTARERARVLEAQARLNAANTEQELFKVGMVRSLNDRIANRGETNDLVREIMLPGSRQVLREVLGEDTANDLFRVLRAESSMHRTYASQFGSQTTPLREAVDQLNFAPRVDAAWYNPMNWPHLAAGLVHENLARTISANRNRELMQLYTTTNPVEQLRILRAMQGLHQARSNAGNAAGKSVLGLGTSLQNARMADTTAQSYSLPGLVPYRP